jgi:hypothetical protein
MSARPGAPEGAEDILTEILAELRSINAKLGQSTVASFGVPATGTVSQERVFELLDEASRRGAAVL